LLLVAKEFDYTLICIQPRLDAFFVRTDLLTCEPLPIMHFGRYTGIAHHRPASADRLKLLVHYPSLVQLYP
jgi:hypothetical protein